MHDNASESLPTFKDLSNLYQGMGAYEPGEKLDEAYLEHLKIFRKHSISECIVVHSLEEIKGLDKIPNENNQPSTGGVFAVKFKVRSTGKIFEVNPSIDHPFYDTMYRSAFRTGEYVLLAGELPDKWK